MIGFLVNVGLVSLVVVLLREVVRAALRPANALGLSLFRPYRRDGWPHGVQEDDDARFSWTAAGSSRAATGTRAPEPAPLVRARAAVGEQAAAVVAEVEDLPASSVAAIAPTGVHVRLSRH